MMFQRVALPGGPLFLVELLGPASAATKIFPADESPRPCPPVSAELYPPDSQRCGAPSRRNSGCVNNALVRGHRIEIRGLGNFKVVHCESRLGRNPLTGGAGFCATKACAALQSR
jgi:hypothetical protein